MEPILTPMEVEAIVALYKGGLGLEGGPIAVDCDLVGGDHLLRRVSPVLDLVRPNLSVSMGKNLTFHLGIHSSVEVLPTDIVPFAALAAGLPRPACVGVLELGSGGKVLLDVDPRLYYLAIERTLGGQTFDANPQRGPTIIEQSIGMRLMERMVRALNSTWEKILNDTLKVVSVEFWPEKIDAIEPEDFVLRQEIEVKIGEVNTSIAVILPATTLEPLRKALDKTVSSFGTLNVREYPEMARRLYGATVDVTVELGKVRLNLGTIRGLKKGDIIRLDSSTGDALPVKISGKTKFFGHPLVARGNMAVELTENN
ncbi:MAG: FliM/FliN family flagellar motor switch protein [Deltaproteobacteria bacterium]|nr:FliM/FliN family flagellar motor switch protein [Deltaproteobacteria bacterium]